MKATERKPGCICGGGVRIDCRAEQHGLVECICGEPKGLHYPDCPRYPAWMKEGAPPVTDLR